MEKNKQHNHRLPHPLIFPGRFRKIKRSLVLSLLCLSITSCSLLFFLDHDIRRLNFEKFDFTYKDTNWQWIKLYGYPYCIFDRDCELIIADDKLYTYILSYEYPPVVIKTADGQHFSGEEADFPAFIELHRILFFDNQFWFFHDKQIAVSNDMKSWTALDTGKR